MKRGRGHRLLCEQHSCDSSIIDTGRIRFSFLSSSVYQTYSFFHYVDGNWPIGFLTSSLCFVYVFSSCRSVGRSGLCVLMVGVMGTAIVVILGGWLVRGVSQHNTYILII